MEYVCLVFAIIGFIAYVELSSVKKRITSLEAQMSKLAGTSAYEERMSLVGIAKSCVGENVAFELKEDYEDVDIVNYGNSKYGTNTILDVDDEWLLVQIDSPRGKKTKLLRIEAIKIIKPYRRSA